MKNEKILEAIGKIDDKLIRGAVKETPKRRKTVWIKWGTMAACLSLMIAMIIIWIPREDMTVTA